MDAKLEWQIATFFQYWRKRLEFIQDLDHSRHNYEANVLIYAALDALSNLWSKNIGKVECADIKNRKRLIFDAFLALYGGDIFQVVSLPDIWSRVDRGDTSMNKKPLPTDVVHLLTEIGGRQKTTFLSERQFRQSSEDWSLKQIADTALTEYPTTDRKHLESWLLLSRYGAIAYKEMRSAYIHEGRSGQGSHGFNLGNSAIRPIYLSGIYTAPPAIGFSVEFMTNVLEDCLNAFEEAALTLQQDPVPD